MTVWEAYLASFLGQLFLIGCMRLLVSVLESQEKIPDHGSFTYVASSPIMRLVRYGRDMNLFEDRMTDDEIEHVIRKKTWNPRWTKPHYPWNSDDPPIGLHNGK